MSGVIAWLGVGITADTSGFMDGMSKASKGLAEMDISARGSRIGIAQLSTAFGASGAAVGGVAQAMFVLGPAIGAVVGAFEIYNHITETAKKNAEDMAKYLQEDIDHVERLNEAVGRMPTEGLFGKGYRDEIKGINKELEEMQKNYEKLSSDWLAGSAELDKLNQEIHKKQNIQNENARLNLEIRPVNEENSRFEDAMLTHKIEDHDKSDEFKQSNELKIVSEHVKKLGDILDTLPQKGANYLTVLKEWKTEHLKELDLMDSIQAKNDKVAAERLKQEKAVNDAIEKQFSAGVEADRKAMEEMVKEANKIHEALETPAEKFRENIEKAIELFKNGALSETDLNKFLGKEGGAITEHSDRVGASGAFKQLDPSRISAAGLAKQGQKQTVHDPEVALAIRESSALVVKAIGEKNSATVGRG